MHKVKITLVTLTILLFSSCLYAQSKSEKQKIQDEKDQTRIFAQEYRKNIDKRACYYISRELLNFEVEEIGKVQSKKDFKDLLWEAKSLNAPMITDLKFEKGIFYGTAVKYKKDFLGLPNPIKKN